MYLFAVYFIHQELSYLEKVMRVSRDDVISQRRLIRFWFLIMIFNQKKAFEIFIINWNQS